MIIPQSSLRRESATVLKSQVRSLREAKGIGRKTAFLCHSHSDETLVKGLVALLEKSDWTAYVDWNDPQMPAAPDKETAVRIKTKIEECNFFLYLATPNSSSSRWCPWEIGVADGKKPYDSILVIPTSDDAGKQSGAEYLQLYRRLELEPYGQLEVYRPGSSLGLRIAQAL